jgi:hypothetical protein
MLDISLLNKLSIKSVFVGQGFDALLSQIRSEQDYLVALFETEKRGVIWITDDVDAGHSIFVTDTKGVNKDKLLQIINPNMVTSTCA